MVHNAKLLTSSTSFNMDSYLSCPHLESAWSLPSGLVHSIQHNFSQIRNVHLFNIVAKQQLFLFLITALWHLLTTNQKSRKRKLISIISSRMFKIKKTLKIAKFGCKNLYILFEYCEWKHKGVSSSVKKCLPHKRLLIFFWNILLLLLFVILFVFLFSEDLKIPHINRVLSKMTAYIVQHYFFPQIWLNTFICFQDDY